MRRRVLVVLAALGAWGCTEPAPPVSQELAPFVLRPRSEADRLLQRAQALEEGDPRRAGALYSEVVAARPMDPLAHAGLARTQVAQGHPAQARRSARRAMRYARASNDVFAIQDSEATLGLVLVAEGRQGDAKRALLTSMFGSDGSEMGCAYQGLGELFARIDAVTGAAATPAEALGAFDAGRPDDVGAVQPGSTPEHHLARALQALFERAEPKEASLAALSPGAAAVVRGHVLVTRKDHAGARAQLDGALTQIGDDGVLRRLAWLGLGWAYGNDGQYESALAAFEQLLAERPDHVLGLLGKANALAWLQDGPGSEAVLRQILAVDPSNPYALSELAGIQLDRGDLDAAEASYRAAMDTTGTGYTCPWEGLGLVYLQRGESDAAELHLRKAIAINPDIEFRKYNALARILLERGEPTEARALLERSVANYPHDPEAARMLADMGAAP